MKEYIVRVYDNRTEWRNLNGKLHREEGPAIETSNGYKSWFQNGKLHREDGPASEYPDGSKQWYQNGKLHRVNGPAIEWTNYTKEWWVNGVRLAEEEFLSKTQVQEMTMEQVCKALGKTIKIVK